MKDEFLQTFRQKTSDVARRLRITANLWGVQNVPGIFNDDATLPVWRPTKLTNEKYEHLWMREFGHRPPEEVGYFQLHKQRYFELFGAMLIYLSDCQRPRVLDIGTSEFLPIYRELIPTMDLITLDRPVEQHGFNREYAIQKSGAIAHYNVDLNEERLSTSFGEPPLGSFNYIVCAEVIEHLRVNPVELLEDLIGLLKDVGYLYLTTPNFFCHQKRLMMERRENPQAIMPRKEDNWDAHHHYREYEMEELKRFVNEAGGKVVSSKFSSCWDEEKLSQIKCKEELSNLVLIIGRQG